jgi:hypothetical protein
VFSFNLYRNPKALNQNLISTLLMSWLEWVGSRVGRGSFS